MCSIRAKNWFRFYLVIQIIIVSLIAAELAIPDWIYVDVSGKYMFTSNNNTFDASSFSGGLIKCNDGCDSKSSYKDFYDSNCNGVKKDISPDSNMSSAKSLMN